jgi:hypothetical protein
MATDLPALRGENFDERVEKATKKAVNLLRSKCVDGQINKIDFNVEVNMIFKEFGLEAEDEDFDEIEVALNNLDCYIKESFLTFDKFLAILD